MGSLILVKLEKEYCDYLRQFDNRVPYNYGKKKTRPFVGVLFTVNDFKYFAPLSSPKPKHLKLKNKFDFLKIDGGKLGAINFNNMVPAMDENVVKLNFDKENILTTSERKYKKLLYEQLRWLNRNSEILYKQSKNIYNKYRNGKLNLNIMNRCCNFPLLEEKCKEYNQKI